jgi:hypothetical protein
VYSVDGYDIQFSAPVYIHNYIPITLSVTPNGSASSTTTVLTIAFRDADSNLTDIPGFAVSDISLSPTLTMKTLTQSSITGVYTLVVSGITSTVYTDMTIGKTGYKITSVNNIHIYYYSGSSGSSGESTKPPGISANIQIRGEASGSSSYIDVKYWLRGADGDGSNSNPVDIGITENSITLSVYDPTSASVTRRNFTHPYVGTYRVHVTPSEDCWCRVLVTYDAEHDLHWGSGDNAVHLFV